MALTTKTRKDEEFEPVKIDTKYLCEGDPNYKKITEADGWVNEEKESPTHLNGWMLTIVNVDKKHKTFVDGRQIEFVNTHQKGEWKCQTCGKVKEIDPYP